MVDHLNQISQIGRKGAISSAVAHSQNSHVSYTQGLVPKFTRGTITGVIGTEGNVEDMAIGGQQASGVWFTLEVFGYSKPITVQCGVPYDILRTCFGTDGNLIGRDCIIEYCGEGETAIKRGRATITTYSEGMYADEAMNGGSLVCVGALQGVNPETPSKNFDTSDPAYNGDSKSQQ